MKGFRETILWRTGMCSMHVFLLCMCAPLMCGGETMSAVEPTAVNAPEAIPLSSIAMPDKQKDTIYDYLQTVEEELSSFKKKNLLKQGEGTFLYMLDDCIDLAIERHLPLEIAKDKIDLYERKLIKALRDLFPTLNLSYEHDRGFKLLKDDTPLSPNSNQQFRSEKTRAALSQPIFKGGSVWNKVNEERANLRAAHAEYDKVFLDLSIEVSKAYFNYAKAKTMLTFKENILSEARSQLRISEEKMNAALISEIEHLNVQSQESQAQHDLEVVKEDIALNLLEMQKAMHLEVSEPIDVDTLEGAYGTALTKELETLSAPETKTEQQEKDIEKLMELAYEHRPEFVIQRNKVEAAIYREKQAVGGWMPQMTMQLEKGRKAEAYIENDNNPPWDDEHRIVFDTKWNLMGNTVHYMYDKNRQGSGVEATDTSTGMDGYYDRRNIVSVGLLDGLDQFIKTKEAEVSRKEAMLELELSEKDIVSEVKEAYYNYNRAQMQLKSVQKRLAYRQKLAELAKHRSEINEIQISEFIQAEIDLVNERDNMYKAMVDYFLAKASVNKAVGIKNYYPIMGTRADTQAQDEKTDNREKKERV